MGYATGWALINATRERLQGMDEDFSLRTFHDALLADGSIALPWVLRNRFGQPLWESVRRSVFRDEGRGTRDEGRGTRKKPDHLT